MAHTSSILDEHQLELRENKTSGRQLIAKKDFQAGDIVLCEYPFVWTPFVGHDTTVSMISKPFYAS